MLRKRDRMLGMHAIGALDRRITIQNFVTTTEHGEPQTTWQDWNEVWAGRDDMSGKEDEPATKETAFTRTTFYIRYLSGVKKYYRVVDEYSNVYDIIGVLEEGRRRFLRLICELRE